MYDTDRHFGKYHDTDFKTERERKEREKRYDNTVGYVYEFKPGIYSDKAYNYAMRTGGDMFMFMEIIGESLRELKFKGLIIPAPSIGISFGFSASGDATMTVKLWVDSTLKNATGEPLFLESERFFMLSTRFDSFLSIFDLIESWKDNIRREMKDRLKEPEPLKQIELFESKNKRRK